MQNRGLCYLPKPKAEADNTDTRYANDMICENRRGLVTRQTLNAISAADIAFIMSSSQAIVN